MDFVGGRDTSFHPNGGSMEKFQRSSEFSRPARLAANPSSHGDSTAYRPASATPAVRRTADAIESVLFAGLIVGLAWAPFWLGSNRMLAWAINGMLFPGIAILYELSRFLSGRPHAVAMRRLAIPAALFAAVIAWIGVQTSTLVPQSLAHPIWSMAAGVLETPIDGAISVSPPASALALLRLLTDASVFWLAVQFCRDAQRAYLLLRAIAMIVAAYAAYGLVTAAFFSGAIPFLDDPAPDHIRSTFVNRNSFATYAGIGLIVTVALTLRHYRRASVSQAGLRAFQLQRMLEATGRGGFFLIGSGLVIVVALLGTGSRGGVLCAALGIASVILLSLSRQRRSATQRIEPLALVTLALAAAFTFFGDVFVGHIATSGLEDASRLAVYRIMAHSILDAPLLGFGYGTFTDIFPMYRDQSISTIGVWDKAHNSYLEVWQGLGLVFGTALIAALAWPVAQCFVGALKRRRDASPPIVAASASLLLGVHSLVDFSLQIQAVSLTFAALIGAGLAQSQSSQNVLSD